MNLSVRLAHYFKPSTIATSTRKFFKHLALYLFTDFKLDIQISKNGYKSDNYYKVQSLVLSLEQYYIFTLNSTRAGGRAMRKIGAAVGAEGIFYFLLAPGPAKFTRKFSQAQRLRQGGQARQKEGAGKREKRKNISEIFLAENNKRDKEK